MRKLVRREFIPCFIGMTAPLGGISNGGTSSVGKLLRPSYEEATLVGCEGAMPVPVRLPDGEIICTTGQPFKTKVLCRSRDGGRTWSTHKTNIQPTTLLLLNDGGLLASVEADREGPRVDIITMWRSDDRGYTWKWLSDLEKPGGYMAFYCYPRMLQLRNGTILAGVLAKEEKAGRLEGKGRQDVLMRRSDDGGLTWSVPSVVMYGGCEASFTELPSGRIVGAVRGSPMCGWPLNMTLDDYYDPVLIKKGEARLLHPELPDYYKVTMFVCSYDGGYHWSAPRPAVGSEEAREAPSDIGYFSDGRLVITSGLKRPGKGARGTLSYDGGKTWDLDRRYILGGDLPDHKGGHCCSVMLENDTILSMFTAYPPNHPATPPTIAAVRWKP